MEERPCSGPIKQYELSTNLERSSFCVPSQRTATSSSLSKPYTWLADLLPATSGSTALDIPAIDNLLLMPAMGIYKILTGIKGPTPKGSVGILLGCSSLTSKGVQVLMGIIDEDYEGKISIMMKIEYPYQIIKGDRIA